MALDEPWTENLVKHADKDKTVYIITSGDKKWRWKRDDLQLICNASDKVNLEPTVAQIREFIHLRLVYA
ncbi:MAG: hypothetical protein FJ042_08345 [Candidatus Cloacimonetes bacterium]|nr:hypothetical protein [Candidatus Cloacimonadota bacterium]